VLRSAYELTDREADRLTALAGHDGITAACSLYRANRLAPLAMNVPRTYRGLGDLLRPLLDEFWTMHTETTDSSRLSGSALTWRTASRQGLRVSSTTRVALTEESDAVRRALIRTIMPTGQSLPQRAG